MKNKNLMMMTLASAVFMVITASKAHAQSIETYTADAGDGVSHIAKKAGLDYMSEDTWNKIAKDNGYDNYNDYHLFVNDTVKVVKSGESTKTVQEKVSKPEPQTRNSSTTNISNIISEASSKYGIRAALLTSLLRHESGLKTDAISSTGDYGIAQINLSSHSDITKEQAFDPYFAIMWAAANLSEKIKKYGEYDALRAYNCGEGGIKKPSCGRTYASNILNDAN